MDPDKKDHARSVSSTDFPSLWELLSDSGYTEAIEFIYEIDSSKSPLNRRLFICKEIFHDCLSSDCVKIENCSGRLRIKWPLLSNKYTVYHKMDAYFTFPLLLQIFKVVIYCVLKMAKTSAMFRKACTYLLQMLLNSADEFSRVLDSNVSAELNRQL